MIELISKSIILVEGIKMKALARITFDQRVMGGKSLHSRNARDGEHDCGPYCFWSREEGYFKAISVSGTGRH
jgi:hypothetical protein